MTLLTVAQGAAARLGVGIPDTIVGNSEETATRLLALVNQSGKELARRYDWKVLTKEHTFPAVADEIQTNTPIPTDFDRFIDGTMFNRTAKRKLKGPLTSEEWQYEKSRSASVLPEAFRIRGSSFLMTPDPTDSDVIVYEYIIKYWVDSTGNGTGDQIGYTADDDVAILDEEVITADTVWRFQQSAGLSYAETYRTAQIMIADRIARDGGRRIINMGVGRRFGPNVPTIPEGDWTL